MLETLFSLLSFVETRTHSKSFILPVIKREKYSCSCPKKSDEDLSNIKFSRFVKALQPLETPPLFSIYVRWKNGKDGRLGHSQDSLHEIFNNFGDIANIVMKSKSSAFVVYTNVEAACGAAKIMQSLGKEMKMHAKWVHKQA